MLERFFSNEDPELDNAIAEVYRELANESADSDGYSKIVDQLTKLYALKENKKGVSPDTLAVVIGNLVGIILIVGHERAHVVTSKALGFVLKAAR